MFKYAPRLILTQGQSVTVQAILVESKVPTVPSRAEEVATMARSIGYQVLDTVIQQRKSLHHTYTIGLGNLEQIKQLVREKNVGSPGVETTPVLGFTLTVTAERPISGIVGDTYRRR